VTSGYWSIDDEAGDQRTSVNDPEVQQFVKTGDIGFVVSGELYIVGRRKNLIIISGANYYAEDIESAVQHCHPLLRENSAAAFALTTDEGESLAIVQEVPRGILAGDAKAVVSTIYQRVLQECGLAANTVALIRRGTLPRTSSGKLQHSACRDQYMAGQFEIIYVLQSDSDGDLFDREGLLAMPVEERRIALRSVVKRLIARVLCCAPETVPEVSTLPQMGADSLAAIRLRALISACLGIDISLDRISQLGLEDLILHIEGKLQSRRGDRGSIPAAVGPETRMLSAGQKAMWFLQKIQPDNDAYILTRAIEIKGALDYPALEAALSELANRHSILRAFITDQLGEPSVKSAAHIDISRTEVSNLSDIAIEKHIRDAGQHRTALTAGPLLAFHLLARSPDEAILIMSAHHIIVDYRSLEVLLRELTAIYISKKTGQPHRLPTPRSYAMFVSWQQTLLSGPEGERLWRYWDQKLKRPLPQLQLPKQCGAKLGIGATHHFVVQEGIVRDLIALARTYGCTVHSLFLTALAITLGRYAGQDEVVVGIVASGRTQPDFLDVVGYCANVLPLLVKIDKTVNYETTARRVYHDLLGALEHQDIPFSDLIRRLQPERDSQQPSALSAVCMWHTAVKHTADLTGFILSKSGSTYSLHDLTLASMPCETVHTQFDLAVACVENGREIACSLQYDQSCLSTEMITGVSRNLVALLQQLVKYPEVPLRLTHLSFSEETDDCVAQENDTAILVPADCIHRQIHRAAARCPRETAVVHGSDTISFGELAQRTNQIARHLNRLGAGPDSCVAILAERSIDMLIGVCGILTSGAAYVPLDPEYPDERLDVILSESRARLIVTTATCAEGIKARQGISVVRLDSQAISLEDTASVVDKAEPENLAYVIFTSGSTGKPKGVMVQHRNVINFFTGMDVKIGCKPGDCMLAVTSLGFDISVLELLWTISRGARVVIADEIFRRERSLKALSPIELSIFYFANSATNNLENRYRLLIEGAKIADSRGFAAVWTPERHFHPFGGLYPSPAVTSAALSTITKRLKIRGGSVVLPLHNPIRVAEEWALIDNLSGGRAGVAFASGWHADDFVFSPGNYADRRNVTFEGIDIIRRLWRGESVEATGGAGRSVSVSIYPKPSQEQIPVWVTAAGSMDTFMNAADIGAHLLTHLLGQSVSELKEKLSAYVSRYYTRSNGRTAPITSVMLHTYIDESPELVRDRALSPFKEYLKSSIDLIARFAQTAQLEFDISKISERDLDDLALFAAERYMQDSGLCGSPYDCLERIEFFREMGVTEIAALIDFGIDTDLTLRSLERLGGLVDRLSKHTSSNLSVLGKDAGSWGVTMMQCTPTFMRSVLNDAEVRSIVAGLRILLMGGESVPKALVEEVKQLGVGKVMNMYGPTETTIWSSAYELSSKDRGVRIGGPIANTKLFLVDDDLQPVPVGATGEVVITGEGISRGYIDDPAQTAERFLPDPFGTVPGARMYRTGDLGRRESSGAIELLGRSDQQVKLRGYRIELGEIEAVLNGIPGSQGAVVVKSINARGLEELIAYVMMETDMQLSPQDIRKRLERRLPPYMIPSRIELTRSLPISINGKIDRSKLSDGRDRDVTLFNSAPHGKATVVERVLIDIWKDALQLPDVSVEDNFFDIGGHSLLMAQVHQRVQDALGYEFPLLKMLEAPTISAIARMLESDKLITQSSETIEVAHRNSALRSIRQRSKAIGR
jgi:natural product biosynthesis luciferase-like monooxygenase protein